MVGVTYISWWGGTEVEVIAAKPEDPISVTWDGLQVTSEPSLLISFRENWVFS